MKTVSIGIQKGGTGKTTVAVSLASELSNYGNTLLIDGDPQGNASEWVLGDKPFSVELAKIMLGQNSLGEAAVKGWKDGLDIIPTAGIGGGLSDYVHAVKDLEQMSAIAKLIKAAEQQGYKYCVFDLSPHFGPFEQGVYKACDDIITPINLEGAAVSGVEIFSENLLKMQHSLEALGMGKIGYYNRLVINMYNRSVRQHRELLEHYREESRGNFEYFFIPQEPAFRTAWVEHKAVTDCGAKKETREGIEKLAESIREEA
jgi:chromosome partitioning protein